MFFQILARNHYREEVKITTSTNNNNQITGENQKKMRRQTNTWFLLKN